MHKRILLAAFIAAAAVVCPAHATVPTTPSSVTYTGNGSSTAYPITFPFLQASDISVTVAGVTKSQSGDYSVSGAGNLSGTATFTSAPANGAAIVITRTVDYKQQASLRSTRYDGTTIEKALDKLAMGEQQLQNLYTNPPATVLPSNVVAKLNGIRFADQFANIQAAITDAGTTGAVLIPSTYVGVDTFSNPNSIPIVDLRGGPAAYRGVASVMDFGAVADGGTDNASAFAAAAAWANAGTKRTLLFPDGTYNYASGLTFTKPVTLLGGQGAILNYTGTALAVKMGPDGLVVGTAHIDPYRVIGLTFTGGTSSIQGIYFNTFVVKPVVQDTYFTNFGSPTGYAIFFQSQNWDARVSNVHWWATGGSAVRNFIRAHGIATDGTASDNGQSRLIVTNTEAGNQSSNTGTQVGVYWNGGLSQILHSSISGFSPNLWPGNNAGTSSAGSHISDTYMEVIHGANPCIMYGESAGTYAAFFTVSLAVSDTHCNVHNNDFGTTARFMGPAGAGSGLQGVRLSRNFALQLTAAQPIVVQNNLVSQTENRADDNRISTSGTFPGTAPKPLHTAGGNIGAWSGSDGEYMLFTNSADVAGVVAVRVGKTTQQFGTFQIEDFNGVLLGAYQCSGAGIGNSCVLYGPGTATGVTVPNTGGIAPKTVTFANLGTPGNMTILGCSDCTIANPCAGGGTGAIAKRLNGVWVCN